MLGISSVCLREHQSCEDTLEILEQGRHAVSHRVVSFRFNRLRIDPASKILHPIAHAACGVPDEARPDATLPPAFQRTRLYMEKLSRFYLIKQTVCRSR